MLKDIKRVIGIIGTRRRDNPSAYKLVEKKFLDIYEEGDFICSGGCAKGGDRFAEAIAKKYGVPILIIYPNWKKFGKGGGFVRNTDIAKNSDLIIACVVHPEEGIVEVLNRKKGGAEDTLKKYVGFHKDGWRIELV